MLSLCEHEGPWLTESGTRSPRQSSVVKGRTEPGFEGVLVVFQ